MSKRRLLLLTVSLGLALLFALYAKTSQAAPIRTTNVVVNDYVYDMNGIQWINVNTFTHAVECGSATIILHDMLQMGYTVEFTGPVSCPYSVTYDVYHGDQVYNHGYYTTYRLRFNSVHSILWTHQHTHVYRPYRQSTVRIHRPKVERRARTVHRRHHRVKTYHRTKVHNRNHNKTRSYKRSGPNRNKPHMKQNKPHRNKHKQKAKRGNRGNRHASAAHRGHRRNHHRR